MVATLVVLIGAAPVSAADLTIGPEALPPCAPEMTPQDESVVVSPWRTVIDRDGTVAEHRVTLRNRGVDTILRSGRRAFAVAPSPGRLLIGERSASGTRLVMVDTRRACRIWARQIPQAAYDVSTSEDGSVVHMAAHEPTTRHFEGRLDIDAETGSTNAMIGGECTTSCEPNDGDVPDAAFTPAGAARPVPAFAAGGWAQNKVLSFSWATGQVPPKWARSGLVSGAADATDSSRSQSPTFRYRSWAYNTVRYGPSFPTFCRLGIACASRAMPAWAVWIRPHGTDFSWGTLRWCERTNTDGCFDLRRVMLHELGHIAGLNHPSTAGFTLAPYATVMHAITPARPKPASRRHVFGRCDVATLQELYDLPGSKALVSSCNNVVTVLRLSASQSTIAAGDSVQLVAMLKVADRTEYGRLGGRKLAARTVKLKYRTAGSDQGWSTLWMRPAAAPGRYRATISPRATWEFKAVFPAPADEGLRFSGSNIVKVKVR